MLVCLPARAITIFVDCTPLAYSLSCVCLRQGHKKLLPEDIDIGQYVAGGIVVFNLRSRNLRWQTHLDLSTDHTQFLAYIYSAPTLVDLNRDGKMEIIVGTSMVSLPCSSALPCHSLGNKGVTGELLVPAQ